AVNVLADQMNLFYALSAKLKHLPNNFGSSQAFLAAARKRNDTVSAKFIAALDNRNERDVWRMPLGFGRSPVVVRFPVAEIRETAASVERLFNRIRNASDGPCPDNKI